VRGEGGGGVGGCGGGGEGGQGHWGVMAQVPPYPLRDRSST